ncbi:MAG: DUF1080 domain-containing protein [Pirellulales bacterium]|nr:DUF1080 domain-containing protein [Pirellulales bacterium]
MRFCSLFLCSVFVLPAFADQPDLKSPSQTSEDNTKRSSNKHVFFDGKTFNGWTTEKGEPVNPGWTIENGVIYRKSRAGHIISAREYGDFELSFEWKLAKGGNSGIKYKLIDYGGWFLGCEYQLIDDAEWGFGSHSKGSTGSIYQLYAPNKQKKLMPIGQYNKSRIVVRGNIIEHWLNGKKIVEADTSSKEWRKRIAMSKFSDKPGFGLNHAGRIMITDHRHPVWLRNIRMVELSPSTLPKPKPNRIERQKNNQSNKSAVPAAIDPPKSPSIPANPRLRLVPLKEINTAGTNENDPWISPDGTKLFFARYGRRKKGSDSKPPGIYVAARKSPQSEFTGEKLLLDGVRRHPTVSPDGLHITFLMRAVDVKEERLWIASRTSTDQPFGAPHRIAVLEEEWPTKSFKFPSFSPDGNQMLFTLGQAKKVFALVFKNKAKPLEGSTIEPIPALEQKADGQNYPWPFFISDGLLMLCCHETPGTGNGRLMLWRRESLSEPFRQGVYLSIPKHGYLYGRSPRYCEATKELFFYGTESLSDGRSFGKEATDLFVLKGFDPSKVVFGSN